MPVSADGILRETLVAKTREEEAAALAVNRQPWDPLPGMRKILCVECDYYFAARSATDTCPECVPKVQRRHARAERASMGW